MRKLLLIMSLLICVTLFGCGSESNIQTSSTDDSIKGNVQIKDKDGNVLITTDDISSVSSGTNDSSPYVKLVFKDNSKETFFKATSENIGNRLSIYVGNSCISEPIVDNAIEDGTVYITGFENEERAKDVVYNIIEGKPKIIAELMKQQSPDNLVAGRIYSLSSGDNPFDFSFIVFYDNNTFRGIKLRLFPNQAKNKHTNQYETTSGTYEINKGALTIKFSNKEYSGAVNGDKISFDKTVFSDKTDGNYSIDFCKCIE